MLKVKIKFIKFRIRYKFLYKQIKSFLYTNSVRIIDSPKYTLS